MPVRTQITTILGALVAIFGALSQPDVLAILPAGWGTAITVIGIIAAAVGRSLLAPANTPRPGE